MKWFRGDPSYFWNSTADIACEYCECIACLRVNSQYQEDRCHFKITASRFGLVLLCKSQVLGEAQHPQLFFSCVRVNRSCTFSIFQAVGFPSWFQDAPSEPVEFALIRWWNNRRLQVTFHPTSKGPPPPRYMDSPFVAAMLEETRNSRFSSSSHERNKRFITILTRRAWCSSREYCDEPSPHFFRESWRRLCTDCTLEFLGLFELTFSAKNTFSTAGATAGAEHLMLSSNRGKAFNFTFTFHTMKEVHLEFSTFQASSKFWIQCAHHRQAHGFCSPYRGVHKQSPSNSSVFRMGSWMPKCLEPSGRNTRKRSS